MLLPKKTIDEMPVGQAAVEIIDKGVNPEVFIRGDTEIMRGLNVMCACFILMVKRFRESKIVK